MELNLVRGFHCHRWTGAVVAFMLVVAAHGCGSSPPTGSGPVAGAGSVSAEVLKPEQLWKYEGQGNARHKVPITRREKRKLLREAQQKPG